MKRYNCRNLLKPIQFTVLYNSRYDVQPFFSILQTFIKYKIKKACLQFRRHSNNVTSLVGRNNEILITIMVLLFLFINFNINFVHMQVTNQWNNHLPWSYNWNNNWKKNKKRIIWTLLDNNIGQQLAISVSKVVSTCHLVYSIFASIPSLFIWYPHQHSMCLWPQYSKGPLYELYIVWVLELRNFFSW